MESEEALLAAYDEQTRGVPAVLPAGVTAERDGPVVRVVGQHRGFVTTRADLGIDGADLDALIARQRDHFAARGESVEWKVRGHDRPAGLPAALRAAGFVPEDEESVLIGSAGELAAIEAPAPQGVTVRRTSDPADFPRIAELMTGIWATDMTFLGGDLLDRVRAAPDDIAVYVAEADGTLVSAAWLEFRLGTDFAGLWGGSTAAPWRGRGIYRRLVALRARAAAARGVRYLQVDASPDSAPILRRLGLRKVTTTTPYVWSPPS